MTGVQAYRLAWTQPAGAAGALGGRCAADLATLSEGNPDQGEWDAIRASPPSTTAVTRGP